MSIVSAMFLPYNIPYMTPFLNLCFKNRRNKWFREYFRIIQNRIDNPIRKTNNGKVESHHIVPRSWFRLNDIPVDNSRENKVNLTIPEHLDAHFSLIRYFKSIGDRKMFNKMYFAVHMMMNMENTDMERIRSFSDKDYDRFEKFRMRHVNPQRKRTVYSITDGRRLRIFFFEKTPRGYTSSFDKGKRARDRFMSVKLTHKGRTKTRREWARLLGLNESTIRTRQMRGLDDDHALGFA